MIIANYIINNTQKEIEVYSGDTETTLVNRIANQNRTLPQYLYPIKESTFIDFLKAVKKSEPYNLVIWDILPTFLELNNPFISDYTKFIQQIIDGLKIEVKDTSKIVSEIDSQYYFRPYMVYTVDPLLHNEFFNFYLSSIEINLPESLKEQFKSYFFPASKDFSSEYLILTDEWKKQYDTLKNKVDIDILKLSTEESRLNEFNIQHTKLRINEKSITVQCALQDEIREYNGDLNFIIFDKIELSSTFNTIKYKDYYKVYNDITSVKCKVDYLQNNTNYIDGRIYISEKCYNVVLNVKKPDNILEIFFVASYSDKDDKILSVLKNALKDVVESFEHKEFDVSGMFEVPNMVIEPTLLTDIIMNDIIISKQFSINDSSTTSLEKNMLRIKFESEKGVIKFLLANKPYDKKVLNKLSIKHFQDISVFKKNNPYLQIKITLAPNEEAINELIENIIKLVSTYKEQESGLIKYYNEYISNFQDTVTLYKEQFEKVVEGKDFPKDVAPDIFLPGYNRLCQTQPRIISQDEAEEIREQKQLQIMQFPKDPRLHLNELQQMPNQYYFVCDNEQGKQYPGLVKNTLSNKKQFPLLPCCFKNNQTYKPEYKSYFDSTVDEAEEIEQEVSGKKQKQEKIGKDRDQKRLILTNKFVFNKDIATINKDLKRLFTLCILNEGGQIFEFGRVGYKQSDASAFHCILEVMSKISEYTEARKIIDYSKLNNDDDVENELERLRNLMFNNDESGCLCKQENYTDSIDIILDKLCYGYFDPIKNIRVLEDLIQTKIYIFHQKDKNGPFELAIPACIGGRIEQTRYSRNIILYTHKGGERDNDDLSQTELLVRWQEDNDGNASNLKFIFGNEDPLIKNCIKVMYDQLKNGYIVNNNISNFEIPFNFNNENIKLVSQAFDSFGKTRLIDVEYNEKVFTLIVSYIQPLKLKQKNNFDIIKTDVETAVNFASSIGCEVRNIYMDEFDKTNTIESIGFVYNNLQIIISVNPSRVRDIDKEVYNDIISLCCLLPQTTTPMESYSIFIKNKHIKFMLEEHSKYLFSQYINSKQLNWYNMNIDIELPNFVKNKIKLNESTSYTIYNTNNEFKQLPSTIEVNSKNLIKKLEYFLKFTYIRNLESLKTYDLQKYIYKPYNTLASFTTNEFTFICKGVKQYENIRKNINEDYESLYVIESDVRKLINQGFDQPKFLFNKEICGNVVFLLNNKTNDFFESFKLNSNWQKIKNSNAYHLFEHSQNILCYSEIINTSKQQSQQPLYFLNSYKYNVNSEDVFVPLLPLSRADVHDQN